MEREQSVAAQVRAEMARRGLKQRQLAEALGVSQQAVSPKYNGHRAYSQRDIWAICDWLGITVVQLLGELGQEIRPLDPDQPRGTLPARPQRAARQGNHRYASIHALPGLSHTTHQAHRTPLATPATRERVAA